MLLRYGINNGIMEYVIIWKDSNNFLKFQFIVSLKTLGILQGHSSVVEDHIRATLFGNAVGDAIGLLTEFLTKEEAKQVLGNETLVALENSDFL